MKETDVAEYFKEVWKPYPLHVVVNTAEPGWPDRFLQLSHSTVVGIEFKVLLANKSRVYKLTHFRKEQAAWFAKWQRFGGYCMLFCAVINWQGDFCGYDMMTQADWRGWIRFNERQFVIGERELLPSNKMVVRRMREWLQTKRLHANVNEQPLTQPVDSGSNSMQERVDA